MEILSCDSRGLEFFFLFRVFSRISRAKNLASRSLHFGRTELNRFLYSISTDMPLLAVLRIPC